MYYKLIVYCQYHIVTVEPLHVKSIVIVERAYLVYQTKYVDRSC